MRVWGTVSTPLPPQTMHSCRRPSCGKKIYELFCSEQVPIVLVGNKRDLDDIERAVETNEGEKLAVQWPHCQFLETSAKDHVEIEKVFTLIVREIEAFQKHKKQRVNDLVAEAKTKKRASGRCTVM